MLDDTSATAAAVEQTDSAEPSPAGRRSTAKLVPLDRLHAVVGECAIIGDHLRALASLFDTALANCDGTRGSCDQLIGQGYLVADIARTMAARLDGVESLGLAHLQQHELEASR